MTFRKLLPYLLIFLCSTSLLLGGCMPSMLNEKLGKPVNEQLYVDARHHFSVQHPLSWQRVQVPVSTPEYRTDTVRWQIIDPQQQDNAIGEMLIRSLPTSPEKELTELLDSFLATKPERKTDQVEPVILPAGPALRHSGSTESRGYLTIAIRGEMQNYIMSFTYPSSRSKKLLPTFQQIVASFREVNGPTEQTKE